MEEPAVQCRTQMLSRATSELLADLLDAVGNLPAVLDCGLRLALHVLKAEQGLIFDSQNNAASYGLDSPATQVLREERLSALLNWRGIAHYSLPEFSQVAENGAPVIGMAGAIQVDSSHLVIGVERPYSPFTSDEQLLMAATMRQMLHPVRCTIEILRFRESKRISAVQLPLHELETVPRLKQIESLLIQEAMKRAKSKREAAAWLGITREGLRKKMVRLGIAV